MHITYVLDSGPILASWMVLMAIGGWVSAFGPPWNLSWLLTRRRSSRPAEGGAPELASSRIDGAGRTGAFTSPSQALWLATNTAQVCEVAR